MAPQEYFNCMPPDFKEKYPNNIVIIDCTEIKIEMPSSFVKQSELFIIQKYQHSQRSCRSVDAKGGFAFISQLYTGSIQGRIQRVG